MATRHIPFLDLLGFGLKTVLGGDRGVVPSVHPWPGWGRLNSSTSGCGWREPQPFGGILIPRDAPISVRELFLERWILLKEGKLRSTGES